MSQQPHEPLTEDQIDKLTRAAIDAGFGHNTQDLMRRYAKDVRSLLAEREHWMKQVQQLTSTNNHLTERLRMATDELAVVEANIDRMEKNEERRA